MEKQFDPGIVGINLARIIKSEDVSIPMLAEWSGVNKTTIRHWVFGNSCPRADHLYKVAQALRLPMENFFMGVGK